MVIRQIKQIIDGLKTTDGAGVNLTRFIGGPELNMLDPFLLLDEFGSDNPDDYIADSAGNEGKLGEGSVQWMTAGRGIVHSEMPIQTDGLVRGFQLWLNLPKEKKMIEPAYQDIHVEEIPIIEEQSGTVKIISGNFQGTLGPGQSHTPVLILDIQLLENSELTIPLTYGWNVFSFIYEGDVFAGQKLSKGQLAIYEKDGDVDFKTKDNKARIFFAAGEPLNEPIARGGPFVMNTRGEILQAFEDYQNGKF